MKFLWPLIAVTFLVGCDAPEVPATQSQPGSSSPAPTAPKSPAGPVSPSPTVVAANRSLGQKVGTRFMRAGWNLLESISVTALDVPPVSQGGAIWGALGTDDRGHIWFAVSANKYEVSARLYEFTADGQLLDRGDVSTALQQAGRVVEGATQHKIHTKIHQADDGYIYFASTDETDENFATETLPKWGSHIWRIKADSPPGNAQ
ncbi:MAG: hypothetical protein K0U93_10910, partial [Gammaproteobacteria bacterium]|nr:hypothetical protein [Gammaproteobacteria bacterium]